MNNIYSTLNTYLQLTQTIVSQIFQEVCKQDKFADQNPHYQAIPTIQNVYFSNETRGLPSYQNGRRPKMAFTKSFHFEQVWCLTTCSLTSFKPQFSLLIFWQIQKAHALVLLLILSLCFAGRILYVTFVFAAFLFRRAASGCPSK